MFAKKVLFVVLAVGLLAAAGPVQAQTYFNNGGGDLNYATPANWSTGLIPAAGETAVIGSSYVVALSSDVSASQPSILQIGDQTAGTPGELDVSGDLLTTVLTTTSSIQVGFGTTAPGTLVVSGGTVSCAGDGLDVGYSGVGTLTQTGGRINCGSESGPNLNIGFTAGSTGTATFDGTASLEASAFRVGYHGTGTLNVQGNASIKAGASCYVGYQTDAGISGTVNVSGNGTLWCDRMDLGINRPAYYNQSGGTVTAQSIFAVGYSANSTESGTATLSGGQLNTNDFEIVRAGGGPTCKFTQTGGTLQAGSVIIGNGTGTATYNMSDGTLNDTGSFMLGNTGATATFSQSGGTVNVTGGSITSNNSGVLALSGGTLNMSGGTIGSVIFQFSGGTLLNANVTTRIALTGAKAVISNDAGYDGTISGIISGSGAGFTKQGLGKLTLTGHLTYTGATTIDAGTLAIDNGVSTTLSSISGAGTLSVGATQADTTLTATSIAVDTLTIGVPPTAAAVPEPGTLVLLFLAGLACAGVYLRRK